MNYEYNIIWTCKKNDLNFLASNKKCNSDTKKEMYKILSTK